MEVKGQVEAVSKKETHTAVKIGGEWFSIWGGCAVEKGDVLSAEYGVKGQFKNIVPETVVVTKEIPSVKIPAPDSTSGKRFLKIFHNSSPEVIEKVLNEFVLHNKVVAWQPQVNIIDLGDGRQDTLLTLFVTYES